MIFKAVLLNPNFVGKVQIVRTKRYKYIVFSNIPERYGVPLAIFGSKKKALKYRDGGFGECRECRRIPAYLFKYGEIPEIKTMELVEK